jgi:hypothetical protein
MKAKSPLAIRWASGYAVLWGGLTVVMPILSYAEYGSLGTALLTSLSGALIIALGFGVYRRSELAAWLLVVFGFIDIVSRIVLGPKGPLMPMILLGLSLWAAIYLRRHPKAETQ